MAVVELWLQIENRPWDLCPQNIDRMHGMAIQQLDGMAPPINVTLHSPETSVTKTRKMYRPTGTKGAASWELQDALIIRRYTPNWAAPADRKVNPWDLNEPDPTDNGTMGTIPGPTIECNVGDQLIVHYRNKDFRTGFSVKSRMHSLHPHGVVFDPKYDGAYPLSPPDSTQPVDAAERPFWDSVGVTGAFKQGDRIPPGGTFTYIWNTFSWPSTAGVWHYHDHAICDVENVSLGALGFLVVHNPNDPDDVIDQDLPGNNLNGSPVRRICFPFERIPLNPIDLVQVKRVMTGPDHSLPDDLDFAVEETGTHHKEAQPTGSKDKKKSTASKHVTEAFVLQKGEFLLDIDIDELVIKRLCFRSYRTPPKKAQYLQYYHEFPGAGMVINGRKFLGNTPTVVAGVDTKMRFGLAAMNMNTFHTFHLHGHRWVIPGPNGTNSNAIQSSVQNTAVSQFEDTRMFGPANSFSFTIDQGSFMGSRFGNAALAPGLGEWHMHCHVLHHMMPDGMMGSLLVVQGGSFAGKLPVGEVCDAGVDHGPENNIIVNNLTFTPNFIMVPSGTVVTFDFQEAFHTVTESLGSDIPLEINQANGAGTNPANNGIQVTVGNAVSRTIVGSPGDVVKYHCGIHGPGMFGSIHIM